MMHNLTKNNFVGKCFVGKCFVRFKSVYNTPPQSPQPQSPQPQSPQPPSPSKRITIDSFKNASESLKNASESTAKDIQDLFSEMRKRRYNTTRFKILLSLFGTFTVFVFYEAITDFISHRATDVTSKSFEDPQFVEDATIFGSAVGKEIVKNLSQDPEVKEMFAEFFTSLFTSDPIKKAAGQLSESVVHSIIMDDEHEIIREQTIALTKKKLCEIFHDPKIQQETSNFIWTTVGGAFYPFSVETKD